MSYVLLTGAAAGAIPNGTRIHKTRHEPGDATPLGTGGVVLASHVAPVLDPLPPGVPQQPAFLYFVEWDTTPGVPVGVSDYKIEAL
jgi:hypothetical protein